MSRPVLGVLDTFEELLDRELLDDFRDDFRLFDRCATRVNLENEIVYASDLSYYGRNQDLKLVRVNDNLRGSSLQVRFQFNDDDGMVPDDLYDAIVQYTVKFDFPPVNVPDVLKWEAGEGGMLKDTNDEYLERGISPEEGLRTAIEHQLSEIVPEYGYQSTITELSGIQIMLRYEEEAELMDSLTPYNHRENCRPSMD